MLNKYVKDAQPCFKNQRITNENKMEYFSGSAWKKLRY